MSFAFHLLIFYSFVIPQFSFALVLRQLDRESLPRLDSNTLRIRDHPASGPSRKPQLASEATYDQGLCCYDTGPTDTYRLPLLCIQKDKLNRLSIEFIDSITATYLY